MKNETYVEIGSKCGRIFLSICFQLDKIWFTWLTTRLEAIIARPGLLCLASPLLTAYSFLNVDKTQSWSIHLESYMYELWRRQKMVQDSENENVGQCLDVICLECSTQLQITSVYRARKHLCWLLPHFCGRVWFFHFLSQIIIYNFLISFPSLWRHRKISSWFKPS